jgi:type IV pilus assembly protein PilC
MASFSYKAIDESGAQVSGLINADSLESAESLLLAKGYIPSGVIPAPEDEASGSSLYDRIISRFGVGDKELILFSKQFRSMMHAGIPIIRIFEVLENQTENKTLRSVIATAGKDIKTGATLYDAFKKHPKIFSPLYLSMVKAGESSGTIVDVLDRLIKIIEHEAKVKSDIKSAMQYPIIVVIALAIAFFVLLTFVIPKFATLFAKVGLDLPVPTKIALWLYSAISDYWAVTLSVVAGIIIGFRMWIRTVKGRFLLDTFFLKIPLFGPLFQKAAMSRFASIFSILQASGVPVMQALDILSGTIGNTAIAKEFEIVRGKISEGQGISGPLSKAKYFPPMVVDMVAIGEESGNIEDMLRQVSIHYDDEVAYAVKGLSDALGPVLVVGLAAVVGFFALAIFLPMWDMTKMVK